MCVGHACTRLCTHVSHTCIHTCVTHMHTQTHASQTLARVHVGARAVVCVRHTPRDTATGMNKVSIGCTQPEDVSQKTHTKCRQWAVSLLTKHKRLCVSASLQGWCRWCVLQLLQLTAKSHSLTRCCLCACAACSRIAAPPAVGRVSSVQERVVIAHIIQPTHHKFQLSCPSFHQPSLSPTSHDLEAGNALQRAR